MGMTPMLGGTCGASATSKISEKLPVLEGRIRASLRRKSFQEENRRILEELKNKELEAVKARADQVLAEARGAGGRVGEDHRGTTPLPGGSWRRRRRRRRGLIGPRANSWRT